MRRPRWLCVLVLAASVPVAALADDPPAPDKQVKAFMEKYHDAIIKPDVAALEKMWAEDIIITSVGGALESRSKLLDLLRSGELKVTSIDTSELTTRSLGDSAVASYKAVIKGNINAQEVTLPCRYTTVLVKREGDWKIIATHGTLIGGDAGQ